MWISLIYALVVVIAPCFGHLTFAVAGGGEDLGYNGNVYVRIGDTVNISCDSQQRNPVVPVSIYQIIQRRRSPKIVVENGILPDWHQDDYDIRRDVSKYTLTIPNSTWSDSTPFACTRSITKENAYIEDVVQFEKLHIGLMNKSLTKFCVLDSDTDNVIFAGDNITLICVNTKVHAIQFRNDSGSREVNISVYENIDSSSCRVSIPNITTELNLTRLHCPNSVDDPPKNENLCAIVRKQLLVFNHLTTTLSPAHTTVPDGGSMDLTCDRTPALIGGVKWNISVTDGNVSYGISNDSNPQYRIRLTNIVFGDDMSAEIRVTCTVTVGSRSSSAEASIRFGPSDSLLSTPSTGHTSSRSAVGASGGAESPFPVITVVIPVVIVGALAAITVAILYVRRRRPRKADPDGGGSVPPTTDDNPYHVDDNAVLGLSADNSVIARSVVYEPYTNDNQNMVSEL